MRRTTLYIAIFCALTTLTSAKAAPLSAEQTANSEYDAVAYLRLAKPSQMTPIQGQYDHDCKCYPSGSQYYSCMTPYACREVQGRCNGNC